MENRHVVVRAYLKAAERLRALPIFPLVASPTLTKSYVLSPFRLYSKPGTRIIFRTITGSAFSGWRSNGLRALLTVGVQNPLAFALRDARPHFQSRSALPLSNWNKLCSILQFQLIPCWPQHVARRFGRLALLNPAGLSHLMRWAMTFC